MRCPFSCQCWTFSRRCVFAVEGWASSRSHACTVRPFAGRCERLQGQSFWIPLSPLILSLCLLPVQHLQCCRCSRLHGVAGFFKGRKKGAGGCITFAASLGQVLSMQVKLILKQGQRASVPRWGQMAVKSWNRVDWCLWVALGMAD